MGMNGESSTTNVAGESSRWQRTLAIMFFSQLITAVGYSTIFPFLPLYVQSLDSTTGLNTELLAGLVFSGQAFAMMFASPIWGAIADRYGRKLMVERSLFGGAVLLLLMAFVRSAEELVLLRTMQGFVTGTVAAANALVAAEAPRARSGCAMGMLQVGLGTGIAVGPLIGGWLADNYGYAMAFYITAALLVVAGFVVLFGVREQFVPARTTSLGVKALLNDWQHLLRVPGVPPTYGLRFLSQLGRMMIVPISPLFILVLLGDSEYANTFTGLVVGAASATTTVSAVFLGRLGDRIGHRKVVVLSAIAAGILYFPQSAVTNGWQLLVLQALVGVALGGVIPTISALLAQYTEMGEEGAVYGMDNSINAAGRAVAPMIGSGVALWFGLRATFVATGFLFLLMGIYARRALPEPASPVRRSLPLQESDSSSLPS